MMTTVTIVWKSNTRAAQALRLVPTAICCRCLTPVRTSRRSLAAATVVAEEAAATLKQARRVTLSTVRVNCLTRGQPSIDDVRRLPSCRPTRREEAEEDSECA